MDWWTEGGLPHAKTGFACKQASLSLSPNQPAPLILTAPTVIVLRVLFVGAVACLPVLLDSFLPPMVPSLRPAVTPPADLGVAVVGLFWGASRVLAWFVLAWFPFGVALFSFVTTRVEEGEQSNLSCHLSTPRWRESDRHSLTYNRKSGEHIVGALCAYRRNEERSNKPLSCDLTSNLTCVYSAMQKHSPLLAFFLFCCITTCNLNRFLFGCHAMDRHKIVQIGEVKRNI